MATSNGTPPNGVPPGVPETVSTTATTDRLKIEDVPETPVYPGDRSILEGKIDGLARQFSGLVRSRDEATERFYRDTFTPLMSRLALAELKADAAGVAAKTAAEAARSVEKITRLALLLVFAAVLILLFYRGR